MAAAADELPDDELLLFGIKGTKLCKKSPTNSGGDGSDGGVHIDAKWSKSNESDDCGCGWWLRLGWGWGSITWLLVFCNVALFNTICEAGTEAEQGDDGDEVEGEHDCEFGDGKDKVEPSEMGLNNVK